MTDLLQNCWKHRENTLFRLKTELIYWHKKAFSHIVELRIYCYLLYTSGDQILKISNFCKTFDEMDDCEMTDKNNCITGHTSRNTDSRRPTYHSFFMAYHFSSFTLPRSCISARWKIQSRNNEKNRNNQFSDWPKTQKFFRFESFTVFVTAGARQIWGTDIWKLQKVARDMNLLGA